MDIESLPNEIAEKCGALYPSGIIADLETIQRNPNAFRDAITTTCSFCGHKNVNIPRNMIYTVLA